MKTQLAFILALIASPALATDWQDSPVIATEFEKAVVQGTFVLYAVSADRLVGYNEARATKRFLPASTFKIPNSLIGLSVGAVADVDEILPYGGNPQPIKAWERDMGLREAIGMSNVPVYQELARRIGLERMAKGVAEIGYGNGEIGTVVDTFWLVGPLEISAMEQATFLARLAKAELPFPMEAQASVREIIQMDSGDGWTLFGKTGWANSCNPAIGWWVGWVEKQGRIYTFALNMDMPQVSDAAKRIELGKACLSALGIL